MPDEYVAEDGSPLTPAQQTEAAALFAQPAAPEVPEATMLDPYKPPQYVGDDDKPLSLTPAQKTEYRRKASIVDPALDLQSGDLVKMARDSEGATDKKFDMLQVFHSREDEIKQDPKAVHNWAQAWKEYRQSTNMGDLPDMATLFSSVGQMVYGAAKQTATAGPSAAEWLAAEQGKPAQSVLDHVPIVHGISLGMIKRLLSGKGVSTPLQTELERSMVESGSSTSTGLQGFVDQMQRLGGLPTKLAREMSKSSLLPEFVKEDIKAGLTEETDQQSIDRLFLDSEKVKIARDTLMGKGPLYLEGTAEGLAAKNAPVRPEEVQEMAAGDVPALVANLVAFKGLGAAMPELFTQAELAAMGRKLAAGTSKVAGTVAGATAKVLPKVAPVLPAAGAVKGTLLGGAAGTGIGYTAGVGAAKLATSIAKKAGVIAEAAPEVAGKVLPTSSYAQLAQSLLRSLPSAAYATGHGAMFDAAIAASSDTPEEMKGVGVGTLFGLLGAGKAMGGQALSGLIAGERGWKNIPAVASRNLFPNLDPLHAENTAAATPLVRNRVNINVNAAQQVNPNGDALFVGPRPLAKIRARASEIMKAPDQPAEVSPFEPPDPNAPPPIAPRPTWGQAMQQASMEVDPFVQGLVAEGMSPEHAYIYSRMNGARAKMPDGRDLIYFRDPASGPHEIAGHGTEGLLGESVMRAFDREIQSDPKYRDNWEQIAQGYASDLGWDGPGSGESWQDAILRMSGWGNLEAREKLVRQQIGEGPYDAKQAQAAWQDIQAKNEGRVAWHDILTPEEQAATVNRYLSREIYAENEAKSFNHKGGFEDTDHSIPAKIARVTAGLMNYLGYDPVRGESSPVEQWPLSFDLMTKAPKLVAKRIAGKPVTAGDVAPLRPGTNTTLPVTPAQQKQALEDARRLTLLAPDIPGVEGGTSQRENLGIVTEAMAKREGVLLNYAGAHGTPGAAPLQTRAARRAESEFDRTAPDSARTLWPKLFFPERVLHTKAGKFLVMGWAPRVFAANAHRVAGALAGSPELATLSPYPIDPATKTFTPEGWKQLYDATNRYVQNHIGGRTGSGVPLVVPRFETQRGLFAPPQGAGEPLPQNEADFISMLFGFKLPDTPRITGGKLPLSIAGEDISKATIPGRTGEPTPVPAKPGKPAHEREAFEGEAAEKLDIEGRDIQEVNPVRRQIETALGDNMPSLIEALQRLRLEEIKSVEHAPEQPQFRANSLTLAAGFQPPREGAQFTPRRLAEDKGDFFPIGHDYAPDLTEFTTPAAKKLQSEGNQLVYHGEPGHRNLFAFDPEGGTVGSAFSRQSAAGEATIYHVSGTPEVQKALHDELAGQIERDGLTPKTSPGAVEPKTSASQFQVTREPEEQPELRAESITGGSVSIPKSLYHLAAEGEGNPWVRRSADPSRSTQSDNKGRTLLVQMSSDLINPESLTGASKDEATRYYDMLYSGARPGYARMQDFWEIPQWIGFASKFLPDADVYVVRDMQQAKEFLNEAGYDRVAFSALDTNKAMIRELAQSYKGNVDVGGYVDPKTFEDMANVKWHDSMESLATDIGVPYENGVDYRHFQGSDVIPRLTMSSGCRHKCTFCTVPKAVVETPAEVVRQQAEAIAKLGTKLVYLNDKTFGQASNYKDLADLNQQIKATNPDFSGFVVQTTAAQLKTMPADWLAKSGIKFVELGIESYNDPILKAMRKPATESLINQVTDKLRQNKIALIPNIIIGHPQETAETYQHTLDFLKANKDIISHANIYNLALYKDTELAKQVVTGADGDFNENVLEKSFHTNPEIHRQFAGDVYGLAQRMLEGKPESAQFQAKRPDNVGEIDDIPETLSGFSGAPTKSREREALSGQFIHGLETLKRLNSQEVARQKRHAEDETSRLSSFAGTADKGIILHSAKQRSTVFLAPADAQDFLAKQATTKGERAKSDLIETYFDKGTALGTEGVAQFQGPRGEEEPRDIKNAALRSRKDGKIFSGPSHGYAYDEIRRAGRNTDDYEEGWITREGEFLDRKAAARRAESQGQMTPGRLWAGAVLHSGDMDIQFQASKEPRAIRAAAVWDPQDESKVWEGPMHFNALTQAMNAGVKGTDLPKLTQGFITNEGEKLSREKAFTRAKELNQIAADAGVKTGRAGTLLSEDLKKPAAREAVSSEVQSLLDVINKSSPEEWADWAHSKGLTNEAYKAGRAVRNKTELATLKNTSEVFAQLARHSIEAKDYEAAQIFATKSQAAAEAYEAATGEMLTGQSKLDILTRLIGPDYRPPMAEPIQAQPPKTYIVRHGSTEMNAEDATQDKIRGFRNVPLSVKGWREAEATADKLKDSGITHIITSDLDRARDTASALAKTTGAPITEDAGLRPWHFGPSIEGKPTSAMLPIIKDLVDNPDKRPPGGETFNEFKDRFLSAFHSAQAEHPDENTALVTHYRGTKLLDAWRETGVDNDTIAKDVFEQYNADKKPGSYDVVDKTGAKISENLPTESGNAVSQSGKLLEEDGFSFTDDPWETGAVDLILTKSGQEVGHILWRQTGEDTAHIAAVRVVPEQRGRGYGVALYQELGARLQKMGVTKVTGEVQDDAMEPRGIRRKVFGNVKEGTRMETFGDEQTEPVESRISPNAQFAPAKNKEWKLKPGSAGFSKAWITPEGKAIQLGGEWHHDWMNANPEIKEKYGIIGTEPDDVRTSALKKGFARINYGINNGILTVEARKSDWPDLLPSVKQFAQANAGKLDHMEVHLFDDKVKRVMESDSSVLFRYSDKEKMNHLPLISAPPETTEMSAQASSAQFQAPKIEDEKPYPGESRRFSIALPGIGSVEGYVKGTHAEVLGIAVTPNQTRKGFGTQLLTRFAEEARKAGATEIGGAIISPEAKRLFDAIFGKPKSEAAIEDWEKTGDFQPVEANYQLGQFQAPFQAKSFDKDLADIRSGKEGGATFNADGTPWQSENRDEHLVSLFSVNLPLGDLNRKTVEDAIRQHFPLLEEPNIKAGIFAFSKDGEPTVSVDLNAVVPNKFMENTKDFAKQNDQVSIWDTSQGEYGAEVPTGGKGNTRLKTTGELTDALAALTQGAKADVNEIIAENKLEGTPQRNELLPGMGAREQSLSPETAARLSNAEMAEYYPESVKPRTLPRNAKGERQHEEIRSNIAESPLAKAAGSQEAAEKSFGKKLVEFAKEWLDHPSFQSGLSWYSEFVPMLKAEFGEHAPIMAELLAGTSPNTNPKQNFEMALDALEGYKAGRFDKQIAKFEQGANMLKSNAWKTWMSKEGHGTDNTPAAFLEEWVKKHNLKPRKANGKLYGISSDAVLKILARRWLEQTPGLKTQNFVQNLLGTGHGATIDLWADRTMRRIGYAGFRTRWRILPKNATGVTDADFRFSQAAFRHAAKELGLTPDALQGGIWFAEKQLWADRGYGKLDLGDYREEIKNVAMLKQGIKQSLATAKKAAKAVTVEPRELNL